MDGLTSHACSLLKEYRISQVWCPSVAPVLGRLRQEGQLVLYGKTLYQNTLQWMSI